MGIQREVNNKSYLETPFSIIGDREIDIIKRIVIKLCYSAIAYLFAIK